MASFFDLFNPTFFIFLAVLLLVTALLVVYFEGKMREQNHKIASMLSLVSSLAEELNGLRLVLMVGGGTGGGSFDPNLNSFNSNTHSNFNSEKNINSMVIPNFLNNSNNGLIEVSDNEEDTDLEEEEEDDDDDDDLEDEDEDNEDDDDDLKTTIFNLNIHDEEEEEEPEIIEIGSENDIKVLKINDLNTENDLEEQDMNSVSDLETLESASEEKKNKNSLDLKSISFSLEENDLKTDSQSKDIKKASLQTLRLLVIEKKLMSDPSKLKKHELLKILGHE